MKKFIFMAATSVVSVSMLMSSVALAINYGGIGGKPANPNPNNPRTQSIFIYSLKPGQSANDAVEVQNNTNQQQTVILDAVDSELATGGNFTCRQAVEPKKDVGSWIQLSSTSVTIPANSDKNVPFTVTVPNNSNIDVGEHDGCITIQAASQTATKSNTSGILLSFRSAIRVVVTIPGKIVKKLSVQSLKVTPVAGGKYKVTPTLSNDGNVSLDASQTIRMLSIFGTPLETVKEGYSPVLPHSKLVQNYTVKRPFWGGFYRVQYEASYNGNPSTELGVSNNANQVTARLDSALFLVAPAPLAALIEVIILLIIIAAIYLLVRSRLNKKHVNKHWEDYSVKKGDTLQSLASSRETSWKKVAQANKLKPPYHLEKGQKLKLPVKKG